MFPASVTGRSAVLISLLSAVLSPLNSFPFVGRPVTLYVSELPSASDPPSVTSFAASSAVVTD